MKIKFNRPVVIPLILAGYLGVMAYLGYPDYKSGVTSALTYFGTIGVTLCLLVLLHFNLKRRDRLRRERLQDMERSNKDNNTDKK